MFERPKSGERAVLVHIEFRRLPDQNDLREFTELALAAGAYPVATVTGYSDMPSPKFFTGSGKVQELKHVVSSEKADIVLFNHELTPAQERNLERELKCRVLDRTGLILDIFAQRARTFEGKLQVELAQLEHLSTRLVRGWTHLERQKGGIGLRGPGETQLETDRRLIRARIYTINKRLGQVRKRRDQRRRGRQKVAIPTVSLVGYTNVGKSSLFNKLVDSDVLVENKLFATLDPTLRSLSLPVVGKVILVDTVGFVRNLPHELIDSFRATLEETNNADLLVHVVDVHDSAFVENMEHVNLVLKSIGADKIPQLVVYNKIDLLMPSEKRENPIERDFKGLPKAVWVSAYTGEGLNLLKEAIKDSLSQDRVKGILHLGPAQGQLRAQLHEMGAVAKEEKDIEGGWNVYLEVSRLHWQKFCTNASGIEKHFRKK